MLVVGSRRLEEPEELTAVKLRHDGVEDVLLDDWKEVVRPNVVGLARVVRVAGPGVLAVTGGRYRQVETERLRSPFQRLEDEKAGRRDDGELDAGLQIDAHGFSSSRWRIWRCSVES